MLTPTAREEASSEMLGACARGNFAGKQLGGESQMEGMLGLTVPNGASLDSSCVPGLHAFRLFPVEVVGTHHCREIPERLKIEEGEEDEDGLKRKRKRRKLKRA